MPGRWRQMYFEQIGAATEAGQPGVATINRLSPMTFVAADLADAVVWASVTGFGVAMIHGAWTRLQAPPDTLAYSATAVGVALLAPIVRDGAVSLLCDVGELWERRHASAESKPESPDDTPIPRVMIKTQAQPHGGTWKFYNSPLRRSGDPIPPRSIKAVARAMVSENFANFSLRHIVTELRLMSDPDFRIFQADLVRRGWATKTANNKVTFEPAGRAMLLKIAAS